MNSQDDMSPPEPSNHATTDPENAIQPNHKTIVSEIYNMNLMKVPKEDMKKPLNEVFEKIASSGII